MNSRRRNFRLTGRVTFTEETVRIGLFRRERRVTLLLEWAGEKSTASWPGEIPESSWVPATEWRTAQPLDLSSTALCWLIKGGEANAP